MSGQKSILKFAAMLWIASVQYFVIQLLVAQGWTHGFSLRNNTISDLGNTACGAYGTRVVCSPLHNLMNVSFVIQGLLMASGAVLLICILQADRWVRWGLGGLVLGGSGTILVGLFPENTVSGLHILGAALPFVLGNVALIILGFKLKLPVTLRWYTVLSGVVALVALGFFLTGRGLGVGTGGMERLTAYPQTIWLIIIGSYFLLRPPMKP